ncbi:hypothetical protein EIP91_008812 [Steccherinum ochraceum]|uniref:Uncharacterized protein n=1 Tax=Steccherinum ochraceum TaxID=92696 RepID=A0A4V2MV56_9APHY|nr:hypothetical protein EIP91_008812 [Steccherinum ochraceum]
MPKVSTVLSTLALGSFGALYVSASAAVEQASIPDRAPNVPTRNTPTPPSPRVSPPAGNGGSSSSNPSASAPRRPSIPQPPRPPTAPRPPRPTPGSGTGADSGNLNGGTSTSPDSNA